MSLFVSHTSGESVESSSDLEHFSGDDETVEDETSLGGLLDFSVESSTEGTLSGSSDDHLCSSSSLLKKKSSTGFLEEISEN